MSAAAMSRNSPPPAPPHLAILGRATPGDRVFVLHYSKSKRTWTGPFPVTSSGEDVMRTTVAIDGNGLVWVIYSTQCAGNLELYAKSV
jgi:hypothetical protein